jgi:hypothetical protein
VRLRGWFEIALACFAKVENELTGVTFLNPMFFDKWYFFDSHWQPF